MKGNKVTPAPLRCDTFEDIMSVEVEVEPEVDEWLDGLTERELAHVAVQIDRLEQLGSRIREPHSKTLGDGLCELRFDLQTVSWRISYYFAPNRRVILLTVFRKQRQNEQAEVKRARAAMARCIAEHEHND
jgi:hypothetical protein